MLMSLLLSYSEDKHGICVASGKPRGVGRRVVCRRMHRMHGKIDRWSKERICTDKEERRLFLLN